MSASESQLDKVSVQIFSPITPPPTPPQTLPSKTLAPLIYHLTTPGLTTSQTLQTLLTSHTNLPSTLLPSLATLGSIYLHHTPTARTSPRAVRQSAHSVFHLLPQRTPLYVRVHVHPKRYLPSYTPVVIAEWQGLLVVHKPPGIPVCAGVDNGQECLTSMLDARVTTRLDVGTSGVLVMAKLPESVKRGNEIVAQAEKYYMVFCEGEAVSAGCWRDWYKKDKQLGRGVREAPLKRWGEDGEGCVEVRLDVVDWMRIGAEDAVSRFVVVVRLATGRTHQIRLQFAARGLLVLGDGKYEQLVGRVYQGGVVGGDAVRLGLHCWKLRLAGKWFTADIRRRDDLVAGLGEQFENWCAQVARIVESGKLRWE